MPLHTQLATPSGSLTSCAAISGGQGPSAPSSSTSRSTPAAPALLSGRIMPAAVGASLQRWVHHCSSGTSGQWVHQCSNAACTQVGHRVSGPAWRPQAVRNQRKQVNCAGVPMRAAGGQACWTRTRDQPGLLEGSAAALWQTHPAAAGLQDSGCEVGWWDVGMHSC